MTVFRAFLDIRKSNDLTVKKTINPGKITDSDEDPKFGKKFLAVESGGRLEIHGLEPKGPVTRLATTLHPKVTIALESVSKKNSKEILKAELNCYRSSIQHSK